MPSQILTNYEENFEETKKCIVNLPKFCIINFDYITGKISSNFQQNNSLKYEVKNVENS